MDAKLHWLALMDAKLHWLALMDAKLHWVNTGYQQNILLLTPQSIYWCWHVYIGICWYWYIHWCWHIYKCWCWHLDIIWSHWTAEYDCIEYDCIELQNMIALDCKYGLHWLVHWLLTLDCIGLHWIELHWIALDCIGLDCIGLHWTKVAYIGLHWHWMWFECLRGTLALNVVWMLAPAEQIQVISGTYWCWHLDIYIGVETHWLKHIGWNTLVQKHRNTLEGW